MDGVGPTYEALRGRPFEALRRRLDTVSALAPFGINFVVNARTLPDLDAATTLAVRKPAKVSMGVTRIAIVPPSMAARPLKRMRLDEVTRVPRSPYRDSTLSHRTPGSVPCTPAACRQRRARRTAPVTLSTPAAATR